MNNQGGCNEERENYRVRGCVRVRRPHGVCIRGIRRAGAQLRSTAEYVACLQQAACGHRPCWPCSVRDPCRQR